MRTVHNRQVAHRDPRRRLERLEALPLRPATARFVLGELTDDPDDGRCERAETTRWRSLTDLDPSWELARTRGSGPFDPLAVVAERSWWPLPSRDGADALSRLWRHSVAVSLAARRLAREANDPDPARVARAGFLHGLGRWAVAAVDPEWLARWLAETDPRGRRELETRDLGKETGALGRDLAERWGCDPLVADAAWLHGEPDRGLEQAAADPRRVVLIQQAFRLAERTPWSLAGIDSREQAQHDPRVKLLTAEVQSRCGGPLLDTDATPREERLTRSNARLILRVLDLSATRESADRLMTSLAGSDPTDEPEAWAERAGLALCGEPGVASVRVVWTGPVPTRSLSTVEGLAGHPDETEADAPERPPSLEIPLTTRGQTFATVRLWSDAGGRPLSLPHAPTLPAWEAWGGLVADRNRLDDRLAQVLLAYRRQLESEDQRLRTSKLDALAEFAAGAGHELNNPLAVIVGRAQLLLVHETDPKAIRSLRAILTQAQRAHRILRDLMYVARPPEPRLRFCQPDEIVRASVRDARVDAEDRDVRLVAEATDHGARVWADPDGLRHLADMLLRNALEATPKGGQVRFATGGDAATLRWTVHDGGRGITPAEGAHLFDPFFCGRQAGRGLGMGLPRATRFVGLNGGEIRWHSTPGQGSTFVVRLPLPEPPRPLNNKQADPPPAAAQATGGRSASA